MGNKFSSKVRDLGGNVPAALGNLKYDPDEKWQSIARERNKNVLYKWVAEESELRKVYENLGEDGVLGFAALHLVPLMFNDGQEPQLIKMSDFEKYRMSSTTVVSGGDKAGSSKRGASSGGGGGEQHVNMVGAMKFEEHRAQWRLNKRGLDGETLLNILLKCEEPVCTDIAYILTCAYPGLVHDMSLGDQYFGQSMLHLAITGDDLDLVKFLIEKGANVLARTTGLFFQPDDQLTNPPAKATNYIGYAYYGEYPLAFTACHGNKDIYDILMRNGADPNKQDSYGNTVLHMCVIHNRSDMYTYAVRHYTTPANAHILNYAGYTPLTLAAKMGRKHIFEEMLLLIKQDYWGYSDMTCGLYPLNTLDTIRPDGSTNHSSALMTIVTGRTSEHLDMLTTEVIQQLLDAKWKAFASFNIESGWDVVRYGSEVFVLIMCIIFVIRQQGNELLSEGIVSYATSLRSAPDKAMFLLANTCLIMLIPTRMFGYFFARSDYAIIAYDIEDVLLCIALPGSWFYLLFFARSIFLTGPFVQMIFSMIGGDILRFAIIASILLMTFAQAFFFLGEPMTQPGSDVYLADTYTFKSFFETFMTLFRMGMGGYDYEEFRYLHFEYFAKFFFVIYMICMPIMMINMLIAMMGNTYTSIIKQAEKAWRAEWARIVMLLEQSVSKQQLRKYQIEYSTEVAAADQFSKNARNHPNSKHANAITVMPDDDGAEVPDALPRGLLIITRSKKTRAQQRKNAKENWKLIVHAIMRVRRELGSVELSWLVCHRRVGKNSVLVDDMDIEPHVEDQLTALLQRYHARRASNMSDSGGGHHPFDIGTMSVVAIAAQRFHHGHTSNVTSVIPSMPSGSSGSVAHKSSLPTGIATRASMRASRDSRDTQIISLDSSPVGSVTSMQEQALSALNSGSSGVRRQEQPRRAGRKPMVKQVSHIIMRDIPPNVPPAHSSPPVTLTTFRRKTPDDPDKATSSPPMTKKDETK